jgi:hypothetical protein
MNGYDPGFHFRSQPQTYKSGSYVPMGAKVASKALSAAGPVAGTAVAGAANAAAVSSATAAGWPAIMAPLALGPAGILIAAGLGGLLGGMLGFGLEGMFEEDIYSEEPPPPPPPPAPPREKLRLADIPKEPLAPQRRIEMASFEQPVSGLRMQPGLDQMLPGFRPQGV